MIKVAIINLINLIQLLIFIRVILSYLRDLHYSKFAKIIHQLTEPILGPVRELLYRLGLERGMLDFSPIAAFLILYLIKVIVVRI